MPRRTMQFTRCYKAGKGKPRLCAPGRVCPARRFHFAPPGLPFLPHRHFNPPNLSTLVAHTCRAPPAAGTAGRGGQAAAGKQAFTQHKGLPCRERAPVITLRPGRRHASARIPFGFTRITCPAALMTAFQPWQPDVSGSLRSMLRHPPPGKAGGLRKPWKGILPAILSSGTGYSVSCITYPVSRKPGSSHYLLHLFGIEHPILPRPELTAKAFLSSPDQPGVVVSLKQKLFTGHLRWPGRRSFFPKRPAPLCRKFSVRRECHLYAGASVRALGARTAAAPPFPLAEKLVY